METHHTRCFKYSYRWFKSYYVVWKLLAPTAMERTTQSLNRTMQYGNVTTSKKILRRGMLFKSYYVVWKLVIGVGFLPKKTSLNRTMQYGNIATGVKRWLTHDCLNRTMQYGNENILFTQPFGKAKFKSYYVVWKLFFPAIAFLTIPGLNRTMQYGNHNPSMVVPSQAFV